MVTLYTRSPEHVRSSSADGSNTVAVAHARLPLTYWFPTHRRTQREAIRGRTPAQRNLLVDALKFFAIALVPAQHLLSCVRVSEPAGGIWLVAVMLSFNMPLFTFLSGYVLPGREGKHPLHFIKNKALILLVPYFAWITLVMPLRHVPPSGWIPALGSALIDPHLGFQMWYLWVLFASYVLFTLARLISKSDLWVGGFGSAWGAAVPAAPADAGNRQTGVALSVPGAGLPHGKAVARLRPYDTWIAARRQRRVRGPHCGPARLRTRTLRAGMAGIIASWAVYRLMPDRLISAQAWVGQKTLGVYGAQMLVLPFVMVGCGWIGAILLR